MTTLQIIDALREFILRQEELEREGDLPDVQWAMISLQYAREALSRVSPQHPPRDFLRHYLQLLENRSNRLTDEDGGEYGSGRDALGMVISQAELLMEERTT
ncbi:MAG TPA: hypothetical protein VLM37_09400 [Fibrobacteraceae bacterium]|nr:hypothetical protein [Fibrobacteraceae bacterium]